MQDMRDLYKAYSAVHDTNIKEELDHNKDQISSMDLRKLTSDDILEVCEEIIEGLFLYGLTFSESYELIASVLEESSDNTIGSRKSKIIRIAESFEKAFDIVTDKAEKNCEEEFIKYRQSKPLVESWTNKVSHEVGNQKIHNSIIHEDRENVKNGLVEMISNAIESLQISESEVVEETPTSTPTSYSVRQSWASAYSSIYEAKDEDEEDEDDKKKSKKTKAKVTDKEDDGEGMDPVGEGDSDIDNDGDSDETDSYLKKRRKAIGKSIKKDDVEEGYVNEAQMPLPTAKMNRKAGNLGREAISSSGDAKQRATQRMNKITSTLNKNADKERMKTFQNLQKKVDQKRKAGVQEGTMDIKGFEIPQKERDAAAERIKKKTAEKRGSSESKLFKGSAADIRKRTNYTSDETRQKKLNSIPVKLMKKESVFSQEEIERINSVVDSWDED